MIRGVACGLVLGPVLVAGAFYLWLIGVLPQFEDQLAHLGD